MDQRIRQYFWQRNLMGGKTQSACLVGRPALVRSALRPALALWLIISYQASNPALGQGLGQGTIVLGL